MDEEQKDSFSPTQLFEELKSTQLDPSVFEKVDERDIPKAPNFLEWVINPRFLNAQVLPKQLEVGTKLCMDYCPDCSNPGYIDDLYDQTIGNIRDNVAFLEHGICLKCKLTRYELWQQNKLPQYNELACCMGQRAGKTKFVGLLANYINHRFLKIPNPLRHYNQPAGDLLMGTFSALTAEQAEHTLWESFKGFMEAGPWYKQYHDFLKAEGKRLGAELFIDRRSFVQYSHKQLIWHYTGSEDRKMRGKTRIFASPDEIGWMNYEDTKSGNQILNADAVYTALSNSLATMRRKWAQIWSPTNYDSPPIFMTSISSPSAGKDKIMRLLKDAQKNPKILAYHAATWQVNPDYNFDDLRKEYAHQDEATFMRDFGAQPPLASNPFLGDPRAVDRVATGELNTNIETVRVRETDGLGDLFLSAKALIKRPDKVITRIMTFDLGHRKNALAACIFSVSHDSKPKLEYSIAITPEAKVPINLAHFFDNFTVPIVKNLNIRFAFFDRWQSLDQVQRLRDMGVDAKVHSLTYKSIENVRGAILAQGVILPKMEQPMTEYVKVYVEKNIWELSLNPIAYLGMQFLTVRDTGTQFAKPLEGDDDIFRAFCLGVDRMSDPAVKKALAASPRKTNSGQAVAPIGTCISKREAGRFAGMTTGGTTSGLIPVFVRSRRKN